MINWPYIAVILALSVTSVSLKIGKDGVELNLQKAQTKIAQMERDVEEERKTAAMQLREQEQIARAAEQELVAAAAAERKRRDEANLAHARRADELLARLRAAEAAARDRSAAIYGLAPGRPAASSPVAKAAERIDWPLVPAAIGEEDVREAQRADLIRESLLSCYADYERAEVIIRGLDSPE